MKIQIPDNLKERLEKYVDDSMPEMEIKKIIYRGNISTREATLIRAYQIDNAINRLEYDGFPKWVTKKLRGDEYWIMSWQKFYDRVADALKHLEEVCEHVEKKYNDTYEYAYLINLDDNYYDDMKKKYGKKTRGNYMKKFSEEAV